MKPSGWSVLSTVLFLAACGGAAPSSPGSSVAAASAAPASAAALAKPSVAAPASPSPSSSGATLIQG
ncbi:MAG TPA: hypothetical protein VKU60_05680, partial [Chloroflexota bacterium]|nr:hypothetical protein [Chloroflexota bacterium]